MRASWFARPPAGPESLALLHDSLAWSVGLLALRCRAHSRPMASSMTAVGPRKSKAWFGRRQTSALVPAPRSPRPSETRRGPSARDGRGNVVARRHGGRWRPAGHGVPDLAHREGSAETAGSGPPLRLPHPGIRSSSWGTPEKQKNTPRSGRLVEQAVVRSHTPCHARALAGRGPRRRRARIPWSPCSTALAQLRPPLPDLADRFLRFRIIKRW
jgi:hypothetical protein